MLAVQAAVAGPEHGEPVGTIPVPANLTAEDVQDAIVMALGVRRWSLREKAPERIVAHIKQRSNEAILTLAYGSSRIEMFCVGWKIDEKSGARRKPELPRGWIKNVKEDIAKNLSRKLAGR